MTSRQKLIIGITLFFIYSCASEESNESTPVIQNAILSTFDGRIDMENLPNYANQDVPEYIFDDNTQANEISDAGAVLGRILFYDKKLSKDNTISCSSCHQQAFAFSDTSLASSGVNGITGRHSMRLINARFGNEVKFFWNERANTLEDQTTMPIQDHVEMGFSGEDGDEDIYELCNKLEAIDYYNELFTLVYGDANVTEERLQQALAQFVRSIQSFDSRYDKGRTQVNNDNDNFPNFSQQENAGKMLFMQRPEFNANGLRIGGGLGCNGCHQAPEFDIDPNSGNNGIIASLNDPTMLDTEVTRSPTLRDIFNAVGRINSPLMHTGFTRDLEDVLNHYNEISADGNGLDRRLAPGGRPQKLQMTQAEKEAVIAFIKTLSGTQVYVDEKWSDPFS